MTTAATIWAYLKLDASKYKEGLKEAEKQTEKSTSNIQSLGKGLTTAGMGLTAAVTAPILAGAKVAIQEAANIQSSQTAVNAVFGDSSDLILQYSKDSASSFAMTSENFNTMAAKMGASLRNTGVAEEDLVDATIDLIGRAVDLGSVFGVDTERAMTAFQSSIMGQYRSMDQFGINLSKAQSKQEAMNMGLADSVGELTLADYAMASYNLILGETERYLGAFEENQGNVNIQLQQAKAEFKNIAGTLGMELIPMVSELLSKVLELVMRFKELPEKTKHNIVVFLGFAAALGPVLIVVGSVINTLASLATLLGSGGLLAGAVTWFTGVAIPAITAALATVGLPVLALILAVVVLIQVIKRFGSQAWGTILMIGDIFRIKFAEIRTAFDQTFPRISNFINKVIELQLALLHLRLPDWLTPGSPTPLEMGLRGINTEMSDIIGGSMPQFGKSLPQNVPMSNQAAQQDNSGIEHAIGDLGDSIKFAVRDAVREAMANV